MDVYFDVTPQISRYVDRQAHWDAKHKPKGPNAVLVAECLSWWWWWFMSCWCLQVKTRADKHPQCGHKRRQHECKECGGAGICQHRRVRRRCKECGGSSITIGGAVRAKSVEGVASVSMHGRQRNKCKECGGAGAHLSARAAAAMVP